MTGREGLSAARRLVVKIGSNALCHASGELDLEVLEALAEEIAGLMETGRHFDKLSVAPHRLLSATPSTVEGRQAVIVSSGAVKVGLARMQTKRSDDLPTRQAAAAIGQSEIIAAYQRAFAKHARPIAQLLITQDELSNFRRYLHLRNALNALLTQFGAVPVMNENDPVSVEGAEIGENDRLAALVAAKIDADLLILLSDVEGYYTGDPTHDAQASLISEVEKITPQMRAQAEEADGRGGRGGMKAKLEAASIATRAGVAVAIASSRTPRVLSRLLAGEAIGTLFLPAMAKLPARKRWIGFARPPKGKLIVDEGACKALLKEGSSLLPVGIANVEGDFRAGDTVSVVDFTGKEIARGLSNYDAGQVKLIRRCKSHEIQAKLGRRDYDEVIHRDNLVIL